MLGRTDRRLRLIVLLAVMVAMAGAIVTRLAYWQVARGSELRDLATSQLVRSTSEPSVRGDILDRRGTVLATTAYDDRLAAYPERVDQRTLPEQVALLAEILGLDGAARRDLQARLSADDPYVVLARRLTDAQSGQVSAALADGRLSGLALEPKPYRFYPNPGGAPGTTLASQLIGFVTEDGVGRYGIEQQYHAVLSGRPRVLAALHDHSGLPLDTSAEVLEPGVPGADVRLTLDASLQLQLEKELYAAWVADRSTRVSALVLDPHDGQVLAWASVPGYDANDFGAVAARSPELLQDPIVSQIYEPGSVMKSFTAAAALSSGAFTLDSIVRDTGALRLGSQSVHNADHRGRGHMKFQNVIAYSRNVATARVALRLGRTVDQSAKRLYETWRRFGIGSRTGVDVSGEVAGIVADPARQRWQPIDLANRSFGQGVAVTPIQLAVAYAAMVNGGTRVQPHVMSSVADQARAPVAPTPVIDRRLATELRGLLQHVVSKVPWYAEGTQIPGYEVGGKTGTAQIWDSERGRWVWNTFNFTFAGFVGRDEPEAVIVTRIHHTQPKVVGRGELELGITSYELFRRIAIDTMTALDIPPAPVAAAPDADAGDDRGSAGRRSRGTDTDTSEPGA